MKKRYQQMNEQINPSPALYHKVMEQAEPRVHRRFRPVAVMAAVLALVLFATPVMAAYVPAINDLMYMVSPEMAARFSPVQKTCTRNGIKMEVVSASIHGAVTEVYISFEDLEGNRVNSQVRAESDEYLLGRSLFLGSGNWGSGVSAAKYDPQTGKAFVMIEENYSFYSSLLGRYLTSDEIYGGRMTVFVEELECYDENGQKQIVNGPWRVTFEIDESGYVGEHDDGVPVTTSPGV